MKDLDDALKTLDRYNDMSLDCFVALLREEKIKVDYEYVEDWKFMGLNNVALYRIITEDNYV